MWKDVHDVAEFKAAINDSSYDLVLVDWYATWCRGCKRAYPELCKLAASEKYTGRIKFVKVCVDEMRGLAKQEGVKALPQVGLYRPGVGFLISFQAVPSKMKVAKQNLDAVLDNPTKFFKTDPNGFFVPTDEDPAGRQAASKAAAAQLKASTGGLFEKLLKQANISDPKEFQAPAASAPAPAPTPDVATSSAAVPSRAPGSTVGGPSMAEAKAAFLAEWGELYGYGGRIDHLYQTEIACRMQPHEHYLDYTGSSLYCKSAVQAAFDELQSNVFGNPHSANPSSSRTEERIETVRELVLRFFNADPAEYQVVFVNGATGALKLTGETFPWREGAVFRYTRENHNSVLGIREYALQRKARFQAVEEEWVEDWIAGHKEDDHFVHPAAGTPSAPVHSLFAFPAEENFAGGKYPLRWIREIQAMSTPEHKWKVLLDAAAFVPTQPLDLTAFPADFVSISFYKMFGFPTGLGALLVRTENVELLEKVFFGGGTVALATSSDDFHVFKCRPSDKLEDGTVPFLDILNLQHGFDFLRRLGGIGRIQDHVHALTRHAYSRLSALRHANGAPLLEIFGNHRHPSPRDVQGGIINFEVLDPAGEVVSYRLVEREAAAAGFHIRTGSHCNPGAAYRDIGVSEAEVESLAGLKEGCDDDIDFMDVQRSQGARGRGNGIVTDADILPVIQAKGLELGHPAEVAMKWVKKPLGSVRVSLGYMSTFEDVEAFCRFMEHTYVDRTAS